MKIPQYNPKIRFIFLGLAILIIIFASGILQIGPKNPISATPSPETSPLYHNFHLLIPALNINAPIVADVDGADQKAYNKALEGGVAQLKGSSKPGEGSNIFIFGHSSFYFWSPGDYKEVFRHLDELQNDDEIIIWYNQKEYKYKISESKVVYPDEVDVIKPTKEEQVSLMTCVPPGTTLKRLIVIGKLE